ncbi:Maintenance of mitochondrial morphology protein [Paramicrosporidium saccamoebae]|uniref:Maintenance of mitochondrial morphology protein n=1 Tax=Paramicrosporidium saccamoebae TaxID=1246581 RepID=A0A2H9TNE4_9FUNG|nr:Maintenance of mitochondrial morphology protein [Paramicrosporidium saccamoebae]
MHSLDFLEKAVSLSSKEFIRGFIIGQFALLLVLLLLARLLFFRSPTPLEPIRFPSKPKSKKAPSPSMPILPGRESCVWVNSILVQLLGPLKTLLLDGDTLEHLSALLNGYVGGSDMVGTMEILKFELGDSCPQVRWIETLSEASWEIQIEWNDVAELDLDTAVILSWPPRQHLASLPCSFSFAVKSVMATLKVVLEGDKMYISALSDGFELDLRIHSLIGHRSKLKDIPKLTSVLRERLRGVIEQKLIDPHRIEMDVGEMARKIILPQPTKTVD